MKKKAIKRLISLAVVATLFAVFCFLPDRLIIAGLLMIALTLVLNLISFVPKEQQSSAERIPIDKYEAAKSEWKKELEHDLNIQKIIRERSHQDLLQQRAQQSQSNRVRQKRIIRVIDQKESEELPYQIVKTRWRKELNDQAFENRIQTVFEKIRHETEPDYQQGLEEIKKLLVLRFNSLKQPGSSINKQ